MLTAHQYTLGSQVLGVDYPALTTSAADLASQARSDVTDRAAAVAAAQAVSQAQHSVARGTAKFTPDAVDLALAELRAMRVEHLPSDIEDALTDTERALRGARSQANFDAAIALGRRTAGQFLGWVQAGKPRESVWQRRVVGKMRAWHLAIGLGGLLVLGVSTGFLWRHK